MDKPKLLQTNNYSLFIPHDHQQPMRDDHILALAESMQKHGFLPSKPVGVYLRPDGKFGTIDGHHRVKAAELAEVWIYYVIEPEPVKELIGEINVISVKWKPSSFVDMYAKQGNEDYITLQRFMGRGIPLTVLTSLMSGSVAGKDGGVTSSQLRRGDFKVKSTDTVAYVLRIFDAIADDCPNIKSAYYVGAFALLRYVKEFELETFYARARANPRNLCKCATRDQAIQTIEEVYNYRSRMEHQPLQLLAKEVLRQHVVSSSQKNMVKVNELNRQRKTKKGDLLL